MVLRLKTGGLRSAVIFPLYKCEGKRRLNVGIMRYYPNTFGWKNICKDTADRELRKTEGLIDNNQRGFRSGR